MPSLLTNIYHEIGLKAFVYSSKDTKLLCLQRLIRLAAYAASTLILALYLIKLGNSESKTGLFMTLTLVGDVFISLLLTVIADKIGRRRMLALGSFLMIVSGVCFAVFSNYWVLLLASVLGVISPSGNEIGPFKAIEESTISQLVSLEDRSSVFAWYTLSGTAGVAVGTISCGWVTRTLREQKGWTAIEAYKLIFYVYAGLGFCIFMLCLLLTKACEVEQPKASELNQNGERRPLLRDDSQDLVETRKPHTVWSALKSLLPELSPQTGTLLLKLCFLFALDSIASGLTPAGWVIYFFHRKFGLKEQKLGDLFFVTSILSSASNLIASSLAKRIGMIKTMVFTHAPASIALALIPVPSNVYGAMALLIFRSSTNSMDQAPRQAFIAAAVFSSERTTVMGVINVVKTLTQSIGPVITGVLAGSGKFWVSFIVAGGIKILYDILLLGMFLGYQTVEEQAQAQAEEEEREEEAGINDLRGVT